MNIYNIINHIHSDWYDLELIVKKQFGIKICSEIFVVLFQVSVNTGQFLRTIGSGLYSNLLKTLFKLKLVKSTFCVAALSRWRSSSYILRHVSTI